MELAHTRNIRHFPTRRLLCNKSRGGARGDPGCTLGDPGHPSGLCDTNVQNHDRPNGHSGVLQPGTYTGTERAAPSETVQADIIQHDNRFSASIDAALGKKGKQNPGRPACLYRSSQQPAAPVGTIKGPCPNSSIRTAPRAKCRTPDNCDTTANVLDEPREEARGDPGDPGSNYNCEQVQAGQQPRGSNSWPKAYRCRHDMLGERRREFTQYDRRNHSQQVTYSTVDRCTSKREPRRGPPTSAKTMGQRIR